MTNYLVCSQPLIPIHFLRRQTCPKSLTSSSKARDWASTRRSPSERTLKSNWVVWFAALLRPSNTSSGIYHKRTSLKPANCWWNTRPKRISLWPSVSLSWTPLKTITRKWSSAKCIMCPGLIRPLSVPHSIYSVSMMTKGCWPILVLTNLTHLTNLAHLRWLRSSAHQLAYYTNASPLMLKARATLQEEGIRCTSDLH